MTRLISFFSASAFCALGFVAQAQEPAAPAESAPPAAQPPMDKGQYLATVGNCANCHTKPGGQPFAGGLAFHTPFGIIYSTNITPDAETGLGGWSEQDFARAMRQGVDRDGRHLYPAFPYTAFTKVGDEDISALYGYLKTIAPVKAADTPNGLGFPFNQRALMAVFSTRSRRATTLARLLASRRRTSPLSGDCSARTCSGLTL